LPSTGARKAKPSRSDFKPLRIAQLAPLYERVPPKLYGGTERVVSYLTEELVRRGHKVTLYASGDSITKAKLVSGYPESLRLAGNNDYGVFAHFPMISDAFKDAEKRFDIIHGHIDYWTFPLAELSPVPTVSSLHGRLDLEHLMPVFQRYRRIPVVSISNHQREPLPFMNWQATVYHGLPPDLLKFHPGHGKYLAFLGRVSPEKGPDVAIKIARKIGIPLKLAAKVDALDKSYWEAVVKPMLAPPDIEYIGEINEVEKNDFLGNAMALLFPIDWPEPFGLVMIEAMACGTPVLTRPRGSVPEIITPGVSGYLANGVDQLVAALRKTLELPRTEVRAEFDRRFTVAQMADGYERVYRRLIARAAARKKKRRR
jgi:glycosyltransferase involved in cell wall biosynthesis